MKYLLGNYMAGVLLFVLGLIVGSSERQAWVIRTLALLVAALLIATLPACTPCALRCEGRGCASQCAIYRW